MALSVPTSITVGETIEVTVSGSSHGGEEVVVRVTNADGTQHHDIPVQLDDSGTGSGSFTVPNWSLVNFDYSTCAQVSRIPVHQPVNQAT